MNYTEQQAMELIHSSCEGIKGLVIVNKYKDEAWIIETKGVRGNYNTLAHYLSMEMCQKCKDKKGHNKR